jgi:hypothetical protein
MKILSGWFFKPFLLLYTLLRVLYETIITTLQTTAKDHTLALKEHSTEVDALYNKIIELESRISSTISFMVASIVSHIFSERIGMILLSTSGLVRASNTLSVLVFLVLGAFLGMM